MNPNDIPPTFVGQPLGTDPQPDKPKFLTKNSYNIAIIGAAILALSVCRIALLFSKGEFYDIAGAFILLFFYLPILFTVVLGLLTGLVTLIKSLVSSSVFNVISIIILGTSFIAFGMVGYAVKQNESLERSASVKSLCTPKSYLTPSEVTILAIKNTERGLELKLKSADYTKEREIITCSNLSISDNQDVEMTYQQLRSLVLARPQPAAVYGYTSYIYGIKLQAYSLASEQLVDQNGNCDLNTPLPKLRAEFSAKEGQLFSYIPTNEFPDYNPRILASAFLCNNAILINRDGSQVPIGSDTEISKLIPGPIIDISMQDGLIYKIQVPILD